MRFSVQSSIAPAVFLSQLASALPQPLPQGDMTMPNPGGCMGHRNEQYADIKEEKYDGALELATGASCDPLPEDGCAVTKGYQWDKSTTHSIGVDVGAGFNVGKVADASGGFSYSYSWSSSKGEAVSAQINCPKGDGFTCGMAVQPKMVKITGRWLHSIPVEGADCEDRGWQDFRVDSVVIKKVRQGMDTGATDGADVTFSPCMADCLDEAGCNNAKAAGLKLCPNTDKPSSYTE